jgi:heme/copper-type cytochrome/quinol oxidase subunit 2
MEGLKLTMGDRMHIHRSARALVLLLGIAGFATAGQAGSGYTSDQSVIQVVSTNVQGKNVYIPSTIIVVAGKPHTLSLFNTTDVPHGFRISGLEIETVLPSKEEHELALPALEGGKIYEIHCQLHAAHRTATLVVLPGAADAMQPGSPMLVE